MPETFFQVIMRLDGELYAPLDSGLYSPELSGDQLTDKATIIKDIVDGQFLGEFVSLFEHERTAYGTFHVWDITNNVIDAREAAE